MVAILKTDIQYFWMFTTTYLFKVDKQGQASGERLLGFRGEALLTSCSAFFVSGSNKLYNIFCLWRCAVEVLS